MPIHSDHKSHNALDDYPTMCPVAFGTDVLWDFATGLNILIRSQWYFISNLIHRSKITLNGVLLYLKTSHEYTRSVAHEIWPI